VAGEPNHVSEKKQVFAPERARVLPCHHWLSIQFFLFIAIPLTVAGIEWGRFSFPLSLFGCGCHPLSIFLSLSWHPRELLVVSGKLFRNSLYLFLSFFLSWCIRSFFWCAPGDVRARSWRRQ
jgi:hypothetical protein